MQYGGSNVNQNALTCLPDAIAQHYSISCDEIPLARVLHAADHSFATPVSLSTGYCPFASFLEGQ
jgi:hypothetical protein